jgi:hypothetical protein
MRCEAHTRFWWEEQIERYHLQDPRQRWEGNIKIDLQEVGCPSMDWIDLVLDSDRWRDFEYTVMNFRVPYNTENFFTT